MTDESIIVNLLGSVVGLDAILATRFSDDPKFLYNALENRGFDVNIIRDILDQMNYNFRMRTPLNKSMLGDIERVIINAFSNINPTLDEINNFERQLVTNPDYMENQEAYPGLEQVGSYFKLVSKNLHENIPTKDANYHKAT